MTNLSWHDPLYHRKTNQPMSLWRTPCQSHASMRSRDFGRHEGHHAQISELGWPTLAQWNREPEGTRGFGSKDRRGGLQSLWGFSDVRVSFIPYKFAVFRRSSWLAMCVVPQEGVPTDQPRVTFQGLYQVWFLEQCAVEMNSSRLLPLKHYHHPKAQRSTIGVVSLSSQTRSGLEQPSLAFQLTNGRGGQRSAWLN